jgi:hypothetical protein
LVHEDLVGGNAGIGFEGKRLELKVLAQCDIELTFSKSELVLETFALMLTVHKCAFLILSLLGQVVIDCIELAEGLNLALNLSLEFLLALLKASSIIT